MRWIAVVFWIGLAAEVFPQSPDQLVVQFPDQPHWNEAQEGALLDFTLTASGGLSGNYSFRLLRGREEGMQLDPAGRFSWQPNYRTVSQSEGKKSFSVLVEVRNEGGQTISRSMTLIVHQQLRIPAFTDVQPFFVKQEIINRYPVALEPDFTVTVAEGALPHGMDASAAGEFIWKPTAEQFEQLEKEPLTINFSVNDTVYGDVVLVPLTILPAATAREEPPSAADPDNAVRLQFPRQLRWNTVNEGEPLSFKLTATGGLDRQYTYQVLNGDRIGLSYDTLGNVYWIPDYDLVDRLEESKRIPLIFEVSNQRGQRDKRQLSLLVYHTNRPPEVGDLKKFYVQYGADNSYALGGENTVNDPDGDPIVFKPVLDQMPQGMTLSAQGELRWKPSVSQYTRLKDDPMELEFIIEDQPYEARSTGTLRIEVTQQDLPPDISMVPNQEHFYIKEDESLNLKFYLSDPNGDDDILGFDFVSDNSRIPREALVRNEPTQYEFVWQPGYDFFTEPGDTGTYQITFFAIDRESQRQERTIAVTVQDAENLVEKDRLLYSQYRTSLMRIWDLMTQLKEREKELSKSYRRARRSKKHRVLTTASIGAITGLSPVVLTNDVTTQKYVAGVGGTTSMTIGSLEAGKVIGKDPSSIYEKLSYINQKLNELQTQGNLFAGKYALSGTRRGDEFSEDLKKLILLLKIEKVTDLELDASWKNPKKASDKNIQDTFRDFNPDPDKSIYIK